MLGLSVNNVVVFVIRFISSTSLMRFPPLAHALISWLGSENCKKKRRIKRNQGAICVGVVARGSALSTPKLEAYGRSRLKWSRHSKARLKRVSQLSDTRYPLCSLPCNLLLRGEAVTAVRISSSRPQSIQCVFNFSGVVTTNRLCVC